ncbi:hypothetical protein [Arenimonas sp. MALMAid1274]|uniref:hypothetical protein n=1 Tax=Arenimonas sp. MALMAid1274 TaxID=3411630 RepID=UPI003BA39227
MRLRRVIEHVREQNWTAIGIDLVIVIVGVFIGIQVANWNETRLEDVRAQAYLARLQDNLGTDLQSIDLREAFWKKVADYGDQAVAYAEDGTLVDGSAWKTALAFYQASQMWLYASDDTTYQELRSGGELGLIRDQGLRGALSTYYREGNSADTDYILGMIPEYRKIVRGLTPSRVSRHIWAHCHRQEEYGNQQLLDCDAPVTEAEAQAVLDAYLRDPRLMEELRFWMSNQAVAAKMIAANRAAAQAMQSRLEAAQ